MLSKKEKAKQFDRAMAGNATVDEILGREKNVFVIYQDAATGRIENQEAYFSWMKANMYTSQYAILIRVIEEEAPINHYKTKQHD